MAYYAVDIRTFKNETYIVEADCARDAEDIALGQAYAEGADNVTVQWATFLHE